MKTRRHILAAAAAAPLLSCKTTPRPPVNQVPESLLQSGDFIFPRDPDDFIPYILGPDAGAVEDRKAWEETRADFLARAARGGTDLTPAEVDVIRSMTYDDFRTIYDSPTPGSLTAGNLSVGHVAIVLIENGKADVVEAVWGDIAKVQRRSYASFASEHADDTKWLARLKGRSPADRHSVAVMANTQVGKPYDFWNFNLNNDAGHYCSKLVWFAVWRALNFAVDGNPNPRRGLWFSPKQLLRQPTLDVPVDPGDFLSEMSAR